MIEVKCLYHMWSPEKKAHTHYQVIFGQRRFTFGRKKIAFCPHICCEEKYSQFQPIPNAQHMHTPEAEEDKTVKEKIFAPLFSGAYICAFIWNGFWLMRAFDVFVWMWTYCCGSSAHEGHWSQFQHWCVCVYLTLRV